MDLIEPETCGSHPATRSSDAYRSIPEKSRIKICPVELVTLASSRTASPRPESPSTL